MASELMQMVKFQSYAKREGLDPVMVGGGHGGTSLDPWGHAPRR